MNKPFTPPQNVKEVLERVNKPKTAVITGGMPYANGPIHLGHMAGAMVPPDIMARYMRMLIGKENVLFVSGNDDHGSTSEVAAIKAGRVRALGITSATRNAQAPDVPTFAESGVPGYEATSWFGMLAPADVPDPVLAKLHHALIKVLSQPDVQKRIAETGGTVVAESPEQFAAFIQAETAKWSKVVKDSGAAFN